MRKATVMVQSSVLCLCLILQLTSLSFAHAAARDSLPSHFSEVDPGFFRGGRPSSAQLENLRAMGIRTEISLQGGDLENSAYAALIRFWEPGETPEAIAAERTAASQLGIQFLNVPINSLARVTEPTDRAIWQVLAILTNPAARPVYLHCEHGKDRTGLIVALYRVQQQNWLVQKAYDEWRSQGHDEIHKLFTGYLDEYFFQKTKQIVFASY